MQEIANPAYLEGFPFPALLRVAPYCVPGGIRVVSGEVKSWWITRRRFLCKTEVAGARGFAESTRRRSDERLQPPCRPPPPIQQGRYHAGLTHEVLTTMRRTGDYGRLWPCRTRAMHDPASELRRMPLPRTRVNKGKRKGRGFDTPARWSSYRPLTAPLLADR